MKLRVLQNVITGGRVLEPGVGDFDAAFGQHLIDLGVAEPYETKVEKVQTKTKKKAKAKSGSSASQPARASRKRTATKSKTKAKS